MLLTIDDAAKFLQCHPDTVRQWAAQGKLRAAKLGKAWRFKQSDLDSYFEALCPSTNGGTSGGSTSSTGVDGLDAALEQGFARLRSERTTNSGRGSGKKSAQAKRSPTPSPHGLKIVRGGEAT